MLDSVLDSVLLPVSRSAFTKFIEIAGGGRGRPPQDWSPAPLAPLGLWPAQQGAADQTTPDLYNALYNSGVAVSLRACLFVLFACAGWGQPLSVYSEFARIDANGRVLAPETPREILSPAAARNAFTSFQVVVEAPMAKAWWLYIGLNPENAVRVTVYRENNGKLEPVELPIPGKGAQVFWMDVWTDKARPVERIKVEPQLNLDDDWVVYPMEVRVMDAVVPDGERPAAEIEPVELMRGYICGVAGRPVTVEGLTPAALRYRNARQDLALAPRAPRAELLRMFGSCTAEAPENPEWYLRFRDYFLRLK